MDNNERFGRLEEVLEEVLIEIQGMNTKIDTINTRMGEMSNQMVEINSTIGSLQQGQQETIGAFNRFAGAVLTKMDEQTTELKGMRQEMKQL
jgi:methyl-accepting chemotaxis protein